MGRKALRKIAAILFVCAVVLMMVKQMTMEETKPRPKAGYMEIKRADYDKLIKDAEEWKEKYEDQLEKTPANKEKRVTVLYLNIDGGMTSKDVSEQLARAGLIKKADDMNAYLAKNKMQHLIQIGEYELTSNMDMKTMANIITGQKDQ